MKKLALLQLLLLPVAGLIDVPSASHPSRAQAQCEHVTHEVSAWETSEAAVRRFARRLMSSGYAHGVPHSHVAPSASR